MNLTLEYERARIERLILILLDIAEAYHNMANIANDKHTHISTSFSNCTEQTCILLVKNLNKLDIKVEANHTCPNCESSNVKKHGSEKQSIH